MSDQEKTKRQLIAELAGLRQRHTDLQRSLQTSPTAVFITRLSDGLIVEANEGAEKLTGYSRDEMIGKTVPQLGLYADASVRQRLVAELRDAGGVHDLQMSLRAKSGDLRHILVSACLTEISGDPCMLAMVFDITPFRRLETALRESEEKYRNLVERANDGICIIQDMVVKYLNPRLAQMWDGSAEEVIGRPFADFVHPDARLMLIGRYQRRLAGEAVPPTYETLLRRKDGSALCVELNVGLIAYEDKSAEMVIVRDISERRHAEESLRVANAYNRSLIEASLDPLVTIGPDGKVTDVNKATQEATGYSREQVIGTDCFDYFTEPEKAREGYQRTFREGEVRDLALDLRHRSGRVTSVLYNASVYRDEAGHVVGVFAAARDITEREQAEEALRQQKEILQTVLDNAPIMTDFVKPDGTLVWANRTWEHVLGWSVADAQARDIFEEFYPDPQERRRALDFTAKADGTWEDFRVRRRDGSVVDTTWANVRLPDGAVVGIGQDITERRRAEAEKETLQAQLLESQKMEAVGQLAGGVAHDFNNLLTVILGGAELLQLSMAPDDHLQDMVSRVRTAGQRAATLVSQLLGYGRKQMIFPRVSNLNDIATRAAGAVRHDLNAAIELTVLPAPDLWPVNVDPEQFTRVIHDLARNAARAMPGGGMLTVETANVTFGAQEVRARPEILPGDYVLLTVSDTGAGMSQEAVARVFEPFFIRSREVADGIGLRMAAVYGIVKQNRGHIFVESQQGAGSTFKVYLPRCEQRGADSSGAQA